MVFTKTLQFNSLFLAPLYSGGRGWARAPSRTRRRSGGSSTGNTGTPGRRATGRTRSQRPTVCGSGHTFWAQMAVPVLFLYTTLEDGHYFIHTTQSRCQTLLYLLSLLDIFIRLLIVIYINFINVINK